MNKLLYIAVWMFMIIGFTCNCSGFFEPETKVVRDADSIYADINVYVEIQSDLVINNKDNPEITFHGIVLDKDTKEPLSDVNIKIAGTDTPGGKTYTKSDGTWEMTIPIVPYKNDENLTTFVIEVQKEGAITSSLEDYCPKVPEIWDLLDVDNPKNYQVAGASYFNVAWENLHSSIECPIQIKMSNK